MKAGIIGGTGYTGRELIKILVRHKNVQDIFVYGRKTGIPLSDEITELKGIYDREILPIDPEKIVREVDVVFMALPHTVSMEYSPFFQEKILLIDLSADYRLVSPLDYQTWYGVPHRDPDGVSRYSYGLPEINRKLIENSKCIANPGCYPTSVILGVLPLLEKKLIYPDIIADSKSGHSGAGKKLTETLHAGNITENIQPYKIIKHQHIGEMTQILSSLYEGTEQVSITFTPSVLPFERGILSTIYVNLNKTLTNEELENLYRQRYKNEPFVRIFPADRLPSPKKCAYTNFCDIAFAINEKSMRVTIISCIDNLLKGASGQAVQNMNIAMGFDEREGLYA